MLKLYTNSPANTFYYNVKMTADYCSYPVQVIVCNKEMQETPDIKGKKGAGQFPFLETPEGTILREGAAIAAYIARKAGQTAMLGLNAFEEAQVEQWISLASSVITPNAKASAFHHFGYKVNAALCKEAENNLKGFAKQLNTALDGKSWLVGERLTLADIVVFTILIMPFTFAYDAGFLKAIPHAASWFSKMSKLPVVARTAGYIKMQGGAPKPQAQVAAAPEKEAAAKPQKGGKQEKGKGKDKKKEEAKPAAAEEDEFDPFAEEDPEEAAAEAKALKEKAAEQAKPKKKKVVIAKSLVILEVKPWGPEVDLDVLGKKICEEVVMDGLVWKTEFKKEPVAFGVFKIVIGCVIEDDKVPMDDLTEAIEAMEDYVQSVDIAAFNKL